MDPQARKQIGAWRPRVEAMRQRWWPDRYAAVVFAAVLLAVTPFVAITPGKPFCLEIKVVVPQEVTLRVLFDSGTGYKDENTSLVGIPAGADAQAAEVSIPVDKIRALRVEVQGSPVTLHLISSSIRRTTDVWARKREFYPIALDTIAPAEESDAVTRDADGLTIKTEAGQGAPALQISFPQPIGVSVDWWHTSYRAALAIFAWLLVWIAAAEMGRSCRLGRLGHALAWMRQRWRPTPAQAIWLVATASLIVSSYPVLFCGKSFASANFINGTYQLYNRYPTLPGSAHPVMEDGEGTDLGPMAWQNGPYAAVQNRALLEDHELPLWNRYDLCGLPLLGQGQSMFGDPFEFIPILGGATAWAWDIKFLVAKLLFAAGAGLLVFAATDCLPAALLLSFSAPFIAFFSYRLNHPAYFSLCYAPWILLAWVELARATTWRRTVGWTAGLLLANWSEMNSGTAKEAYMLLLCLNLTGLVVLAIDRQPWKTKLCRLWLLAGAGAVFCLLAAPVLAAFFDTLKKCETGYDAPHAFQLQPSLVIGLFDDIFTRQLSLGQTRVEPGANFLMLAGTLLALANFPRLLANRVFSAVAFSALVPCALVFGMVPSDWIRATPFLGNIYHIDNTFSCVLIIQLFVLAGFGLRVCLRPCGWAAWSRSVLTAFLLGAILLGAYFGFLNAAHRTDITFLKPDQQIPVSRFFRWYVPTIVLALLPLPFVLRRLRMRGPEFGSVLLLLSCLCAMLWRFGVQMHSPFYEFTPVLPDRSDWFAHSSAVDYLHADRSSPYRIIGLGANLYFGYGMLAGLETISGVDALNSVYLSRLDVAAISAAHQRFTERHDLSHFADCKPFHDLLNVRYFIVAAHDDWLQVSQNPPRLVPGLSLVAARDLDVYRNATVWPRAFFVDRLATHHGVDEFAARVMDGDGRPFASCDTDDVAHEPSLAGQSHEPAGDRTVVPATDYRLTNSETAFSIDAPSAGVVVLTEVYIPGDIHARVDGRDVPVFRVNEAFRGIPLRTPGHHRITFVYRPPHFDLALVAFGLGLFLLAAGGWVVSRLEPRAMFLDGAQKLDPSRDLP